MDKENTILIIAQNGLKTAATLLGTKAVRLERQAEKNQGKPGAAKLTKQAARNRKLAAILLAADEGITAYLKERDSEA
jgi:hypothetical protein